MKADRMLICVFVICGLISGGILAAEDVQDIVEEVQDRYEEMQNFSAKFVQIESFHLTGSKNESSGMIYVKNGVKYRLETEDQVVVTDGKNLWTYSAFNNQVILDRLKEGDGSLLPRDMLFRYPKEYLATLLDEVELNDEAYYLIKLDPRENVHGFIKSMKIWVRQDDYLIDQIEYTDFNDNTTTIEIRQVDSKSNLPDSMFTYQPKEGTEVIDLRM